MHNKKEVPQLTQKELAYRWGCSIRTVRRRVLAFGMKVADFIGCQPVFSESEAIRAEELRKKKLLKAHGVSGKVISIKEAKKFAAQNKRRAA